MRLRDAKKLRNRDEVLVRKHDGSGWEQGQVLGEPRLACPILLIIPVQSPTDGLREVDHFDVR
jgi:hypothetical protein